MRLLRFIIVTLLLFPCAPFIHAQGGSVVKIDLAVTRQIFASQEVSVLAEQSKLILQERLNALFRTPLIANPPIYHQLPPSAKPIAFQVHETANFTASASAFAIQIKNHLFGVTAGHVMRNISQNPYMRFQTREGFFESVPITSWRISNLMGTDVAVFEIPPQAQEYVQPLPLATERAQVSQVASIAGFNLSQPRWFSQEEILLTSPHRLFIRNNYPLGISGMCGSPVMVNGNVVGLYVGSFPGGAPSTFLWPKLVQEFSAERLPPLHMASPIENILPLIHDLMQYDTQNEGILMKVLGKSIAVLHPTDELYSVSLIRNGKVQTVVRAEELTDPEHLEQFLELEEDDILRITIFLGAPVGKHSILHYEVNVSSGVVSQLEDNI